MIVGIKIHIDGSFGFVIFASPNKWSSSIEISRVDTNTFVLVVFPQKNEVKVF